MKNFLILILSAFILFSLVQCKKIENAISAVTAFATQKNSKTIEESNEINSETVANLRNQIFSKKNYLKLADEITDADLSYFTFSELKILRQMIFARKGYKFISPYYQNYFKKFSWYFDIEANNNIVLSETEQKNVNKILAFEQKRAEQRAPDRKTVFKYFLLNILKYCIVDQNFGKHNFNSLHNDDSEELLVNNYSGLPNILWASLVYAFVDAADKTLSKDKSEYRDIPSILWHYARQDTTDLKVINSVFEFHFGQPLIIKEQRITRDSFSDYILHYNPQILKDIFNTLYIKPTGHIFKTSAHNLYIALFKEFVNNELDNLFEFYNDLELFTTEYEQYIKILFDNEDSSLYEFYVQSNEAHSNKKYTESDYIGLIYRRHHDRTLPVINELILQFLKEYDTYKFDEIQTLYSKEINSYNKMANKK